MDEMFLLKNKNAQKIYHNHIKKLPIIDYHNHLSVNDLVNNRKYSDIAELWLLSDPYKHRAMRICGISERLITGEGSNYEKFVAWCDIVPKLIGNPLYHWSNMEMANVFGIEDEICKKNAEIIWNKANSMLQTEGYSARNLLNRFSVEYAAPCCMISEDTEIFEGLNGVVPSLRVDDIFPVTKEFLNKLEYAGCEKINSLLDLKTVLHQRIDMFHKAGCRFADHALDHGFTYTSDDGKNNTRFASILKNKSLSKLDADALSCELLRYLASEYSEYGWTMQLHIGALRNTGSRLRHITGSSGGFAGIGTLDIEHIANFLDEMDCLNKLPRTILFTLNPSYNEAISILSGTFSEGNVSGKVQQGTAWWWCDHFKGIEEVLECVSAYSVLSTFYGMTTDSRSLLSFVRHDYFRRIFCNWLCEKVENDGFMVNNDTLKEIAENVCYYNIKKIVK